MKTVFICVLLVFSILHLQADDASDITACQEHMKTVYDGIQAYRKKHHDLPGNLKALVPGFIKGPEALNCGKNPRRPLGYECSDRTIYNKPKLAPKEWKRMQMGLVGGKVPLLRCFEHGRALKLG